MQQSKNKSMVTRCILDIGSVTEEVEEDRKKLVIGKIVKWLVSSLSAAREGTERQNRFRPVLLQSFVSWLCFSSGGFTL